MIPIFEINVSGKGTRIRYEKSKNSVKNAFICYWFTGFPRTTCHATFNCMKSDIQSQLNKNISLFSCALRLCETPPSPPAPDPVGIENCKQLFSPLLAFTTRNEKSCLQFLIPTAVFHMLLKRNNPHWAVQAPQPYVRNVA